MQKTISTQVSVEKLLKNCSKTVQTLFKNCSRLQQSYSINVRLHVFFSRFFEPVRNTRLGQFLLKRGPEMCTKMHGFSVSGNAL